MHKCTYVGSLSNKNYKPDTVVPLLNILSAFPWLEGLIHTRHMQLITVGILERYCYW